MKDIRLVMKVVDDNQNTLYVVDDKTNVYSESAYNSLSNTCNFINDFGTCNRIVRIKSKVKDSNGSILWYLDEDLRRYSLDDLISLINSKRVAINMYLRNNVPTSYSGVIESLYKTDDVLVVIEDSTGGYKFYKWFLESCFPSVNFHCVSSNGNGNIDEITLLNLSNYKKVVILFDNKLEESFLQPKINSLMDELYKNNINFVFFNPLCIEEILLSFKELYNVQHKNNILVDLISQSFQKNILYYSFDGYLYNISSLNISVKNIEKEFAKILKELTYNTLFSYKHKNVGGCYFKNCCNSYAFVKNIDKVNNIVTTSDSLKSIQLKLNCNFNERVRIKYLYYKDYSILKNLYLGVASLLDNKEIDNHLLYTLRS